MNLIKSKKRVVDHGEVFTPPWMVEAMLDLVKAETERIDSRFLEPTCGSGHFMLAILRRKFAAVELKYGASRFDRRCFALLALMSIYGIELLQDNVQECRHAMLEQFTAHLGLESADPLVQAAHHVLMANVVHGDALSMRAHDGRPITFAEWGYLGKGRYMRRDFRLDTLTNSSSFSAEGSLFAGLGKHEIFQPVREYPPMTIRDLGGLTGPSTSPAPQEAIA